MNTRLVFIMMGILLFSFGVVNAACTNPSGSGIKITGVQWGNSTRPVAAGPGSVDVPLTVSMEVFGNSCALSNIQGTLELYGGLSNFNGSSISRSFIPNENAYSIFNMVFNLDISKNLSVGQNTTLTYPLYVAWNYTENGTERYTQQLSLNVPFRGAPQLVFNISNPYLTAGQDSNVTIQVSNKGTGTAYNIQVPVSSSTLNFISQPKTIAELAPGEIANVSFSAYVPPTLGGSEVNVNFRQSYIDPYGYNESNSSTDQLYVLQNQGTVRISASNETIYSGLINNVSIIIDNSGTSALNNISITFSPGSSLSMLNSDGFMFVPKLSADSSISIPISVYPSGSGAVSDIGVALSYSGGSISRTLSFLTPGYINLSTVSTTVLPATPLKGEIFSITSTLENIGSVTADAVTVTPKPPKGITVVGQNSTFIGDIQAYTPTAVTFSFTASPMLASGTYNIPVELQYVNNINQKLNKTLYYTVAVGGSASGNTIAATGYGNYTRYSAARGSPIGIILIIVIVVIIAIAALYLYQRRKNSKSKVRK